jgi:hypothetical protein
MTALPHRLSQYRDGEVWVVFCKVCSGEGDQLKVPCPGKYVDKIVDKDKEPD